MAYDTEKRKYGREPFWFVEIEVDGDTHRFCQNRSPLPVGLTAQPTLTSRPTVNPAQIDLTGGIGVRAKCSISMIEAPDYTTWGTPNEPERFWARWRAENPYYLGERISVYSGYIPENNVFDESDYVRRDYIIESFSMAAGGVSITGKDPLKLADNDRAKAPVESNGTLSADIDETATSFTLLPAGIGDDEYPASNGIVRIGDEVILYTTRTDDTFSGLTRAYYGTEVDSHSEGDTAQLCLLIDSQKPYLIDQMLLETYAGVDSSYIPINDWQAASDNNFITTYTTLITEPTGVQDLIEEFCESCPHYLFYDERINQIRWVALAPPPSDATLFTYESNLLEGTTVVKDRQDLRVSTMVINYGIINPTKDLDESSNYRVTYARIDPDSISNYGQQAYKTVNSRWIPSDNKTAAVLLGARVGRRFAEAPRQLTFSVDAKDSDVWAGDSVKIKSDLVMQSGGGYPELFYQITSAGQTANYNYTVLEHTYGDALPQDEDVEDPNVRLVYISSEVDQLKDEAGTIRNLREYYEDVFGTDPIDPDLDIRFIFESSAVAGSSDNTAYAVNTGAWPELSMPILIQNSGLIVGRGGDGAIPTRSATDGGPALRLQANIRLNNLNIIGGGGGGGDFGSASQGGIVAIAGGGGGAGYIVGAAGSSTYVNPSNNTVSTEPAEDGTYTDYGKGGVATAIDGTEIFQAIGRRGGNLGFDGVGLNGTEGVAGKAIDLNGFTITYINTGTILGDVS